MITYEIPNFCTDVELLHIENIKDNSKIYIANNNKKLILHQVKLLNTIVEKIKPYGKIIKSEIYELEQPYRIHNDSRNEKQSKFTCILPLDLDPQGGVTVFDQWACNFTYSLDDYYQSNYNKLLLDINDREKLIQEFDVSKKLPDIESLSHIKDNDKIGFTIAKEFTFKFNTLVVFPSKHFHCSQNVSNFTNKSSLVIFTS